MNPLGALARRLADAGYSVLAPYSRMHREFAESRVEDYLADVRLVVDQGSVAAAKAVVLVGHSMGTAIVSAYQAQFKDARVVAIGLFAPCRDLPEWVRAGIGDAEYENQVRLARRSSESASPIDFVDVEFVMPPPAQGGHTTRHVLRADPWLDWYGPESPTRVRENLSKINVPVYVAAGDQDPFVTERYLADVRTAATNEQSTKTFYQGGVGHEFDAVIGRAVSDFAVWLNSVCDGPIRSETSTIATAPHAGSAIKLSTAYSTAAHAALWIPAPDRDPFQQQAWDVASRSATPEIDIFYTALFPGGYLPLTRDLSETKQSVRAWIEHFGREGYTQVSIILSGNAPGLLDLKGLGHLFPGLSLYWLSAESEEPRIITSGERESPDTEQDGAAPAEIVQLTFDHNRLSRAGILSTRGNAQQLQGSQITLREGAAFRDSELGRVVEIEGNPSNISGFLNNAAEQS
jgi:pimeloyl-ACP methyl ester carboxylesterase